MIWAVFDFKFHKCGEYFDQLSDFSALEARPYTVDIRNANEIIRWCVGERSLYLQTWIRHLVLISSKTGIVKAFTREDHGSKSHAIL